MQTISAATATEDDLFIGISDSGKTASVVDCLKVAKKKAATLAITSSSKSPIHTIADLTLLTPMHAPSTRSWESTTENLANFTDRYSVCLLWVRQFLFNDSLIGRNSRGIEVDTALKIKLSLNVLFQSAFTKRKPNALYFP